MWNVVTLDGCFEGKQPWDLSFHELVWGPELEVFIIEQLHEADILIFGKNTYVGMADYWPKAAKTDPEVADIMNNISKVVCSSSLKEAGWNNTTIVHDAKKELQLLKERGDKPMFVFGSAKLSESILNAGLFDEIRLCVAPILLGKGRRLFSSKIDSRKLKLVESNPFANGGIILRYIIQNDK